MRRSCVVDRLFLQTVVPAALTAGDSFIACGYEADCARNYMPYTIQKVSGFILELEKNRSMCYNRFK